MYTIRAATSALRQSHNRPYYCPPLGYKLSTPSKQPLTQPFLSAQVRYAATHLEPAKSARARGSYLRVSYKNTRETAQAINGWKLTRALTYLENVKGHVEAVPMRRYAGGTGRASQGTYNQ